MIKTAQDMYANPIKVDQQMRL